MEIFGIGPLELLLIVFLALIVLGPKEMIETSKKAAGWLKKLRQSDAWKTTKEVMDIPTKVMQETGLDKELRELNTLTKKTLSPTTWNGDALSAPQKPTDELKPSAPAETETQSDEDKNAN
jgi:Sec-independent protein translocase protein TatA